MLSGWHSLQALPGFHPMLVRKQGAEALVSQQQHGTLCWQACHKVVVASGKGPDAQLASSARVVLCRVQSQIYLQQGLRTGFDSSF